MNPQIILESVDFPAPFFPYNVDHFSMMNMLLEVI